MSLLFVMVAVVAVRNGLKQLLHVGMHETGLHLIRTPTNLTLIESLLEIRNECWSHPISLKLLELSFKHLNSFSELVCRAPFQSVEALKSLQNRNKIRPLQRQYMCRFVSLCADMAVGWHVL